MYDWIIIVMSNKRVPPDPSRYLFVSYLPCLHVLRRRSAAQGGDMRGWRGRKVG